MRLINIHTLQQQEFIKSPPYAILSHRWTDEELAFKDYDSLNELDTAGARKVKDFCAFIRRREERASKEDDRMVGISPYGPQDSNGLSAVELFRSASQRQANVLARNENLEQSDDHLKLAAEKAIDEEPPDDDSDDLSIANNGDELSIASNEAVFDPPRHAIDWVWIDTCCIDKRSSAELTESINSMWSWYWRAEYCIAFLNDVLLSAEGGTQVKIPLDSTPKTTERWDRQCRSEEVRGGLVRGGFSRVGYNDTDRTVQDFSESEWFERGWTLQELLAPNEVIFCDREWHVMGTKQDPEFCRAISAASGIPMLYLTKPTAVFGASVAQRLSWASGRKTTREEDAGYCLLGLFAVNIPLIYGEGWKAFLRLQEEIIKQSDDESILAWAHGLSQHSTSIDGTLEPVLARHPADFVLSHNVHRIDKIPREPYSITNKGLHMIADAAYIEYYDIYVVQINCAEGHLATTSDLEAFTQQHSLESQSAGPAVVPCLIALKETRKGVFARINSSYLDLGNWIGSSTSPLSKPSTIVKDKRFLLETEDADTGWARTQEYRLISGGQIQYLVKDPHVGNVSQRLFGGEYDQDQGYTRKTEVVLSKPQSLGGFRRAP